MKKIVYILWALLPIIVIACDNDDSVSEIASLTIVESTVDFQASGGEGYIKVENGSDGMEATSSVGWCKIVNATSDKITFTIAQNNDIMTRAAVVVVKQSGQAKQVCITQAGILSQYDKSSYYRFTNVAFTKKINFTSTAAISVTVDEGARSWLTYEITEGGYVFKGSGNETGKARVGKATIVSGPNSVDYYFIQYDVEGLLGKYIGAAQVASNYLTISNPVVSLESGTEIVKKEGAEGQYLFRLKMSSFLQTTLTLTATYRNGAFVITTPQPQEYTYASATGETYFSSMILADAEGLFLEGNLMIAPILVEGELMLSYVSDTSLILGLFNTEIPDVDEYAGKYTEFSVILLQQVIE